MLAAALLGPPPASAATEPVRIAGVRHFGDLPTFVADERGLFARAGLDVQVSWLANGRLALERLRTGEADFALTALTPLVLDRLADTAPNDDDDPVILASLVQSNRLNRIVTLDDRGIRGPADLRGRRLGLTRGTNAEFHWWLYARFHGIDPEAVRIVDLQKDTVDEALAAGRVDAGVLWQPWIARLRGRVGQRVRVLDGRALYAAHWVLVTRRATAEQRRHRCAAVLRAYLNAAEAIQREPDRALAGFRRALGLPGGAAPPEGYPYGFQVHLDWSVLAALGQQFDWAAATGRSPPGPAPSILALVAPAPLTAAAPGAVNVAADLLDAERTP